MKIATMGAGTPPKSPLPTIGSRLEETRGIGPNFNALRLLAAFAVLVSHAFAIPFGNETKEPLVILSGGEHSIGRVAVVVFFAMSGFLVTPSLTRSGSLTRFASKRAARILPGLIVIIAITTLLLGPFLTSTSLSAYFGNPLTYWYPIGTLHKAGVGLPGVFQDLPLKGVVNGSLWTLKYEALSYVLLASIGACGLLRFPYAVAAVAGAVAVAAEMLSFTDPSGGVLATLKAFSVLFAFFAAGVSFAVWRDRIPVSWPLGAAALILAFTTLVFGGFYLIGPLFLTYAVISIGVLPPVIKAHIIRGDFSYGVYLWAFPIQQIAQQLLRAGTLTNILLAAPVTLVIASLSWTLVEEPALRLSRSGRGERRPATKPRLHAIISSAEN